jgi:hypothetical protein
VLPAVSALSLPPQAATAAAKAAKPANDVVLTDATCTSSCGASAFCTSTFLIVSTRSSLTAGGVILLGRGVRRTHSSAHEPAIRELLPSNNS